MELSYTDVQSYPNILSRLRKNFNEGLTRPYDFRVFQLKQLRRLINENLPLLHEAVHKDLRKCYTEFEFIEIHKLLREIDYALKNLEDWMKPEKPKTSFKDSLNKPQIRKEPYGLVLIMSAWNYPVILSLNPFIAAIAAGNTVVLKPSEISSHTAAVLTRLLPQYLNPNAYTIINGGAAETTQLLEHRFDYILYTGSTNVGKIIMSAAAKYLTPVTLELGGKSPTIVDKTLDVEMVAKRILWGKFMNAGQTCIAPDYVLCDAEIKDSLVQAFIKVTKDFLGEDPQKSRSFARIINKRHFLRLKSAYENHHTGKIAYGGIFDENDLYVSPTFIVDMDPSDSFMQEEIFGPILPIITYKHINEAIQFINSREKPLALYVFSKDQSLIDQVLNSTQSGGVCINDTLAHISPQEIPFGGVGQSGMGSYHGKFGFETFSHSRSTFEMPLYLESLLSMRYPPFDGPENQWKLKGLRAHGIPKESSYVKLLKKSSVFLIPSLIAVAYYFKFRQA